MAGLRASSVRRAHHGKRVPARRSSIMASTNMERMKAKAKSLGLNTDEGIFGFTPFSEMWTGRLAMCGFTIGVASELITGEPILMQVGLGDGQPNQTLFAGLLLAMVVPTVVSIASTISSAANGNMSVATFRRWVSLFALDTEAAALKDENGFVAPSSPWPRKTREQMEQEEFQEFATEIELANGRWAMLGFASAILIEAATGGGVFQQLIW
eukprot:CAMPEP_0114237710 /NCGR_PEP_ID=MMETSP0058-20121206/7535_1 /TAXON_ID=36894 /ORGANISM="Pyramimonas parkeae, CCMP726" /LENGTH=211 /DNA_ID=CAMNT_0001349769 /DNA_START=161 /DNA_END=793 /DNA_ORIENTATION=-